MTYNVFGATLNLAQSESLICGSFLQYRLHQVSLSSKFRHLYVSDILM